MSEIAFVAIFSSWHTGGCHSLHDFFFEIWSGIEFQFHSYPKSFPVYCLIHVRIFIHRRQSVLPSNGMQEKTIVLFCLWPLPLFPGALWVTTEAAWVSFGTLSMCLPLKTLSHLLLDEGCFSILILGDWTPFHNIVWDSEVSSCHHLINVMFYSFLQLWIIRFSTFAPFLDHRKPTQSEVEQTFL